MLVGSQPRRVAVIGGVRIPFARANGAYAAVGNQEMLTASLKAVVERFRLRRRTPGRRHRGRRDEAFQPVEPGARVAARFRPLAGDARPRRAACLRHQHRGRDRDRQQDRARPDRCGHRRRRRHGQRPADRLRPRVPATAAAQPPRPHVRRAHQALVRIAAAAFQAFVPGRRRAAHRHVHGPAHRKDGAHLEDRARRPGRTGAREPPACQQGLGRGLHVGPGRAVPRA